MRSEKGGSGSAETDIEEREEVGDLARRCYGTSRQRGIGGEERVHHGGRRGEETTCVAVEVEGAAGRGNGDAPELVAVGGVDSAGK